jgi:helix-turn-helix protein
MGMTMTRPHPWTSDAPKAEGICASRLHFSDRRRQNGVSLLDISRRTNIPLPLLEDLEQERFDRFPPGIFARSYVRAYAEEACLDLKLTLARVISKLPGDEALDVIPDASQGWRFSSAVTLPFRQRKHAVTMFLAAAVLLVAIGMSATQTGANVVRTIHQLMSPPLTKGELAAAAPRQEAEAQPVATSGTGPAPAAVGGATVARPGRSRVERVFSKIGGLFKKLFTGDDEKH